MGTLRLPRIEDRITDAQLPTKSVETEGPASAYQIAHTIGFFENFERLIVPVPSSKPLEAVIFI